MLVTQATSPFYAPRPTGPSSRPSRPRSADHPAGLPEAQPYHIHVPSFGEWGFVLAGRGSIDASGLRPSIPTEVLDADSLGALFVFDKALGARPAVRPNTLDDPVLAELYSRGWRTWHD